MKSQLITVKIEGLMEETYELKEMELVGVCTSQRKTEIAENLRRVMWNCFKEPCNTPSYRYLLVNKLTV